MKIFQTPAQRRHNQLLLWLGGLIILVLILALATISIAPVPASSQVLDQDHDGGVGRCVTDLNGSCLQPHGLGQVPTDIQVTMVRGGTSALATNQTTGDFRVTVLSGTVPKANTSVVYWWHVWARPSPSSSTTTTTEPIPPTTTSTTLPPTTIPPTTLPPTTVPPPPPNVDQNLVPRNGAWWGNYVSSNPADVPGREQISGRQYDVVQYYHDWNDTFPTPAEAQLAAQGRILRMIFNGRDFSNSANNVNWCQIASGDLDQNLVRIAGNLKGFGQKLFLTFHGEPEGSDGVTCQGRSGTSSGSGTLTEFVQAWRHVHDVLTNQGVQNAVWVWSMANPDSTTADQAYPGDAYTDWASWDPYNWYTCGGHSDAWTQLATKMGKFYSWAQTKHPNLPLMLGEYGSMDPESPSKGDWFRTAAEELSQFRPQVKAVIYFDRVSDGCDWRITTTPGSLQGWVDMGQASYFNQPHS